MALAGLGQVADEFARVDVVHDGATGYFDVEVLAGTTRLVATRAAVATFGAEFSGNAEIRQRVEALIGHEVDTADVTAVTAVGAALLDVFFTTKTQAAVAAVAGLHADGGFVDEFHRDSLAVNAKDPAKAGSFGH